MGGRGVEYLGGILRGRVLGVGYLYYMSRFCLCWRCTRAGMSGDPDVVLSRWAFWVQVT